VNDLLPFLVVGIFTGSLYGLAAMGLVLTYRTSGVFNFGHGAIAAGAAFVFYTLHINHGWPWPVAVIATVVLFGVVVGPLLEWVTRRLATVPSVISIVATVGILLTAQGLLYLIYGDVTRTFPEFLPTSGFTVSTVLVTWSQVISVAIASVSAFGLWLMLRATRLGVSMRAVVDNTTLTGLSGQAATRIRRGAWSIGSAFAALSGVLLAPTLGLDPLLLTLLVVQAFGAAAIGRFSSLPMTYAGGLIVGVSASLATKYFTSQSLSGVPSTVPFLVLIVILLVVPVRSLPRQISSVRNLAPEPMNLPMSVKAAGAVVLAGVAVLLPNMVGARLPLWINAMVYVILFGSLALLVWVSGQVSACHMAFAALGVTNMAHFSNHMPWLVAVLLAGAATVPVGAIVAIPALRLSGIYLALITLGFGVLMQNVFYLSSWMFSTDLRVSAPRPDLWGIGGSGDKSYYYIVLAFAAATCAGITVIYRGRLGRLLRAMAESPTMLTTHGLSVAVCRLLVFCVSAFLAGIAGALSLSQTGSAAGISYGPVQSLLLLAVLAVSGVRLLGSTIIAALLLAVLPGYVTDFGISNFNINRQLLAFGLAAVAASLIVAYREPMNSWFTARRMAHADRLRHGPVRGRSVLFGNAGGRS
jgi:branched-subunit amino acid ABC-type transport system permease component